MPPPEGVLDTRRRPRGRPGTHCRDSVSHLAWVPLLPLGLPPAELEEVFRESKVCAGNWQTEWLFCHIATKGPFMDCQRSDNNVESEKKNLFSRLIRAHALAHKSVKCVLLCAWLVSKGRARKPQRRLSLQQLSPQNTTVGRCVEIYCSALFASLVALLDGGSSFSQGRQT